MPQFIKQTVDSEDGSKVVTYFNLDHVISAVVTGSESLHLTLTSLHEGSNRTATLHDNDAKKAIKTIEFTIK